MKPWSLSLVACIVACLALDAFAAESPAIKGVTFEPPSPLVRFYHAKVELAAADAGYTIHQTAVGDRPDVYVSFIDGKPWQYNFEGPRGSIDPRIPAGKDVTLRIRCAWENGQEYPVRISYDTKAALEEAKARAKAAGKNPDRARPTPIVIEGKGKAPAAGGFPYPGWSEYRLLVLGEDQGIARESEPQLLFLSAPKSLVSSWHDQVRVAAFDPATGKAREIPSQVLSEKTLAVSPAEAKKPARHDAFVAPAPDHVQTTCQIAFLADVPARGKSFYLVVYGNPDAKAPSYETDLKVVKDDQGATWIENECWRAQLDPKSGQFAGAISKLFGTGEDRSFGLKQYPLHYNPDVWVSGRAWTHTHAWNPPAETRISAGPVAVVTRRWGTLPGAPEVRVHVTYYFFSRCPYAITESTIDIEKDLVVNALRNEEIVFAPRTQIDHIGYKRTGGEIGYKDISVEPGKTRGMLNVIEPDAPYVSMIREGSKLGMAGIRLGQFAGSRGADPAVLATNCTVLADYGWGFRYWSRALVYPWGDYLADESAIINAGTYYSERSAYCIFPLGDGPKPEAKLAWLEQLSRRLHAPVRIDHQGAGPW